MNQVTFTGVIATDPRVGQTNSGTKTYNARIAVPKRVRRDGAVNADFFNFSIYGRSAEIAGERLKRGMHVVLTGRLQNRPFQVGDRRITTDELIVQRWEFAQAPEQNDQTEQEGETKTENENQ